ncbi:MAG: hypothetical protein GKR96_10815 [Gammaproteobacteria bacterium]|nr:hypothetical protein [Gammaproteobacteria bacterium]
MNLNLIRLMVVFFLMFSLSYPKIGAADDSGSIRVYKLTKKGQLKKRDWTKKVTHDVCFNFKKAQKGHRFAQTRYQYCTLFASPNCDENNSITSMWGGDKYRVSGLILDVTQPQTKLYRGTKWVLHPSENISFESMRCH